MGYGDFRALGRILHLPGDEKCGAGRALKNGSVGDWECGGGVILLCCALFGLDESLPSNDIHFVNLQQRACCTVVQAVCLWLCQPFSLLILAMRIIQRYQVGW